MCEPALTQLEAIASGSLPPERLPEEACILSLRTLAACATGMVPPDQDLALLDGDVQQSSSLDESVVAIRQRLLLLVTMVVEKFGNHDEVAIVSASFSTSRELY